jgi:hypothetical protein
MTTEPNATQTTSPPMLADPDPDGGPAMSAPREADCTCGGKLRLEGLNILHSLPYCETIKKLPWPTEVANAITALRFGR